MSPPLRELLETRTRYRAGITARPSSPRVRPSRDDRSGCLGTDRDRLADARRQTVKSVRRHIEDEPAPRLL